MENVPGLVQHDGQKTIGSMAEYLRLAGYRTRWEIIDAAAAGAAQHRPRLYLVASRLDLPAFDFHRVPRSPPGCIAHLLTPESPAWLAPAKYTLINPPIRQASGMVFAGYLNRPLREPGRDPRLSSAHHDQSRIYDARGLHPALRAARWCWPCSPVRVGDRVRRLVPRELLRLQGFPDDFTFPRRGLLHQQIGNAVYVPLVQLVLREVRAQLLG
jgi:DNA (cytosine-5)-methyltransferase 1